MITIGDFRHFVKAYIGSNEINSCYIGSENIYGNNPEPIQSGLICWLDGRDGQNRRRSSKWPDRSGHGNDGDIIGLDGTEASGWDGKNLVLDKINDYVKVNLGKTFDKDFTIQTTVIFNEMPTKNYGRVFHTKASSAVASHKCFIGTYGSIINNYLLQAGRSETSEVSQARPIKLENKMTFTISKKDGVCSFYENDTYLRDDDAPAHSFDEIYFNNEYDKPYQYANAFDICSILFYDRPLTKDEITHNKEYESTVDRGLEYEEDVIPEVVAQDGLICWLDGRDGYEDDRVWIDRTGNGNNVDLIGFNAGGMWTGASLRFDGKSRCVADKNKRFNLPNITMSTTFKMNRTNSNMDISSFDEVAGSGVVIFSQSPKLAFVRGDSSAAIDKNKYEDMFSEVTVVGNGENWKVYFDGQMVKDMNLKDKAGVVNAFLSLGSLRDLTSGRTYFNGDIYSIKIYDRPLTGKEVEGNWKYEKAINRDEIITPVSDKLICWLDGRDGTNIDKVDAWKDRSGLGNYAILTGLDFNNDSGWLGNVLAFDDKDDNLRINIPHMANHARTFEVKGVIKDNLGLRFLDFLEGDTDSPSLYIDNKTTISFKYGSNSRPTKSIETIKPGDEVHSFWFVDEEKKQLSMTLFINGRKQQSNVVTLTNNGGIMYNSLGFNDAKNCILKYFHTIRIYDKVLTEDEITRNVAYEDSIDRSTKLQPITNGLVNWFDFADGKDKEDTLDCRASNNKLVLSNFNFDENSGWTGSGLKFDGVNDWCSFSEKNCINNMVNSNLFTYCVTCKLVSKQYIPLFVTGAPSAAKAMQLGSFNSKVFVGRFNDDGVGQDFPNNVLATITYVNFEKNKFKAYVNDDAGSLIELKDLTNDVEIDSEATIGKLVNGMTSNRIISGLVYSVKIYNRALTSEEIVHNYKYEQSIVRINNTKILNTLEHEKSYGIGYASQLSEIQLNTFRLSNDKNKFVAGLRYCDGLEVEEYSYDEIIIKMNESDWNDAEMLKNN
ncbi:MAG: LamG-like jellyroll fold domain-containing protein [Mycoplasma sp.]